MAMKEKIESCPLCGKYDPVIDLGDDNLRRVVCQACHHQGVGMPSADEAIREWNRSARYYRNISMEISGGLEIKKIMQCKKCGYTCFEEDWNGLFCPRCGEQQDKSDNGGDE